MPARPPQAASHVKRGTLRTAQATSGPAGGSGALRLGPIVYPAYSYDGALRAIGLFSALLPQHPPPPGPTRSSYSRAGPITSH
eukprot:15443302-Alexandrium_andersonii.AAC.1